MNKPTETTIRSSIEGREECQVVREMGKKMAPQELLYLGSAAVHFYRMRGSDGWSFINQVMIDDVPEHIAQKGNRNLTENIMVQYGRKPKSEFFK